MGLNITIQEEKRLAGRFAFSSFGYLKANEYGWMPEISIEESIRSTVRYLLSEDSKRFR